jgi:hypothetical protein
VPVQISREEVEAVQVNPIDMHAERSTPAIPSGMTGVANHSPLLL